jgi:VWFA-related protein
LEGEVAHHGRSSKIDPQANQPVLRHPPGAVDRRRLVRALVSGVIQLGLIGALIFWPSSAFSESISRVAISRIDATHLPDLRVIVGVLDGAGSPVPNLGPSNFEVNQDGAPVEVTSAAPSTEAMTIVLAMDTSGSMNDRDSAGHVKIDEARQAAESFVNTINKLTAASTTSPDVLAVISFSDHPTIVSPPSTDHNRAINAIRELKSQPKWTALYDAAFQAVKAAESARPGERAVVLFTDGNDEGPNNKPASSVTLDDVIALSQKNDVPIYTLGFGADADQDVLGRLATLTGGGYAATSDLTKLSGLFQNVATQLKSKYVVRYTSCATATDHAIQVRVHDAGGEALDQLSTHYSAIPPIVQVWEPKSASPIQGEVDLVPGFGACQQHPIVGVEFQVNGQVVGRADREPWVVRWDSGSLAPGQVDVAVRAVDSAGLTDTSHVAVTVLPPLPTATATDLPTPEPTMTPLPLPTAAPTAVPTLTSSSQNVAGVLTGDSQGVLTGDSRIALVALVVALAGLLLIVLALVLALLRPRPVDPTYFWTAGPPASPTPSAGGPTIAFANLTGIKGDGLVGKVFPIGDRAVVGRDSLCDVAIDDPSRTLSRRHAEIRREERGFVLYDLDSRNGTHVGEVPARKGEGILLADDVEITLGARYVVQFSEAVDNNGSLMTMPLEQGETEPLSPGT